MVRYEKGQGVIHRAFGRGTVTAVRLNGHEVRVSFGTFALWVDERELSPTGTGLRLVRSSPGPAPRGPAHSSSFEAILRLLGRDGSGPRPDGREPVAARAADPAPTRAAPRPESGPVFRPTRESRPVEDATVLESFRLGIVPASQLSEWTVGREREVALIRSFLRDAAEGAVLIEGAYGAGKSHLLRYLEQDALDNGFAVSSAGFDPSEATAAFPKKAWRRMVRGFRARLDGTITDFRGFVRALVERPTWRDALGGHPLLGQFLERVAKGRDQEEDWDWIEGRSSGESWRNPTLHEYTTCANIYCNLVSSFSRAAAEVFGLSGLVVLLDEAEVAGSVLYRYQALRGMNFFRGLVLTANDDPVLLEESLARRDTVEGVLSGLVYSGHNPLRYTGGIPAHLKVAFALTPGSLQDAFRRARESIQVIELEVLSPDQLRDLFGRICDRFESVTGIRVSPRDRERMYRLLVSTDRVTSTRGFIKASIEALDFVRFYPEGDVDAMIARG